MARDYLIGNMASGWASQLWRPVTERFCYAFCSDVRKRSPEVLRWEVPGFLGYYDGDEFRVAVAVSLPALLYVRLRPPKSPAVPSFPSRGPRSQP